MDVVQNVCTQAGDKHLQDAENDRGNLQTDSVSFAHDAFASLFPHHADGRDGVELGLAMLPRRVLVPCPGKTLRFAFGPIGFAGVSTLSSAIPQGERAGTESPGLKRN